MVTELDPKPFWMAVGGAKNFQMVEPKPWRSLKISFRFQSPNLVKQASCRNSTTVFSFQWTKSFLSRSQKLYMLNQELEPKRLFVWNHMCMGVHIFGDAEFLPIFALIFPKQRINSKFLSKWKIWKFTALNHSCITTTQHIVIAFS